MVLIKAGKYTDVHFRVPEELKRRLEQKFPVRTKRSKLMRELLRMYLDGEIKQPVRIVETL